MLAVISTVAQHPLGSKIHFPNLKWATDGVECFVIIQTFEEYRFKYENFYFREEKSHLNDPNNYFSFYGEIEFYLKNLLEKGVKVFCFTQQDILFYKNIKEVYEESLSNGNVICSFHMPYQYTIYNENFCKQKVSHLKFQDWEFVEYPRIWEGCCFIPSFLIEKFLNEGIKFGHHPKRFRKNGDLFLKYLDVLKNKKISLKGNEIKTIADYISTWENNKGNLKKFGHDTFFEISLFCYLNNFEVTTDSPKPSTNWVDFHISNHAVHFHYIEKVCRETKNLVYKNPKIIYEREDCKFSTADVAFMLLMSGACSDVRLFWDCPKFSIKETLKKINLFKENYMLWMNERQQSLFKKLTFEKLF